MDAVAFRILYDAHYPDVVRFTRGVIQNDADVEEIVQDVFIRVAMRYSGFQAKANVRTWILAITRNIVIDYMRANSRITRTSAAFVRDLTTRSHTSTVETEVIHRDEWASALRCLNRLPISMRMVVMCRVYHELSTVETAKVMNWSPARVRVTYSRAIRKFQTEWCREQQPLDVKLQTRH